MNFAAIKRSIPPVGVTDPMEIDPSPMNTFLKHGTESLPDFQECLETSYIPEFDSAGYFSSDYMNGVATAGFFSSNGFSGFSDPAVYPAYNSEDFLSWNYFPMALENYNGGKLLPELPQEINEATSLRTSADLSTCCSKESLSPRTSRSTSHTRDTSEPSQFGSSGPHNRENSSSSSKTVEMSVLDAAAVAESAWPLARCNPVIFSDTCPRTALVHLEALEQSSQDETLWSSLVDSPFSATSSGVNVVPIAGGTRDRMLAITQTFLHKALAIHRGGLYGWTKSSVQASPGGGINFLVLPPVNALEYFLQNYVRSLTSYFSLVSSGTIDPNEMMLNNQASTLLVLLMIAQGATAIHTTEARQLTAGLTETCRISLFDIIEKDAELSADPVVLRCALLFTMLAAWGGDKWHMDIAMGQRGMYLSMLEHAGMLEPQLPFCPEFDDSSSKHLQWRSWVKRETKIRLTCNWLMLDQELSLFHDAACVLSTTDLRTPIPSHESLWLARDADEWLTAFKESGDHCRRRPSLAPTSKMSPSLCDLFQDLLHDNIRSDDQLTPLHFKLLLHPLHTLVLHLRQVLGCFSDWPGSYIGARTVTKASTLTRLEEVQSLLQKWYGLCVSHTNTWRGTMAAQENLVLYHAISLNAITSLPEIERLARTEFLEFSSLNSSQAFKRLLNQPEQAVFHSGQIIRLVNLMPKESRPHWWPAAIYRATMIIWAYGISRNNTSPSKKESSGNTFTINSVSPEHPAVASYLWNSEGVPVLINEDGGVTNLDSTDEILFQCSLFLTHGIASRMSEGIQRKLLDLRLNWRREIPFNSA
ncbi:hypothetical protein LSUE1_G000433 [Lachnellula suecica]|uniref:Transcription factor domain-containing protein n=1 Tax=Lachnellula suecica TaxID=602035 RepID=A0A8T9CLT6_9HELO|nr:hypothetical protein LSUE1_G000433 [Lachnellula suecica]